MNKDMNADNPIPNQLRNLLRQESSEEQRELEQVWHLTDQPAPQLDDSVLNSAVQRFEKRLRQPQDRLAHPRKRSFRRTWPVLATFVVVVLIATGFFFTPATHVAAPDAPLHLTLSDGTSVVLNNGSQLRHTRLLWGTQRQVTLNGEAFFEVSKGQRPFVVHTQNASVQVLGTQFNVEGWQQQSPQTILTVAEGRVRFRGTVADTSSVILTTNQTSVIQGNHGRPTPPTITNADLAKLWTSGGFAAINRTLEELTRSLEHRFNITIVLDASLETGMALTWIQPRITTAEQALTDICALASCSVEPGEDGFVIIP